MDVSPADVGSSGRLIIDGGICLEALGYRERRGPVLQSTPCCIPVTSARVGFASMATSDRISDRVKQKRCQGQRCDRRDAQIHR